MVYFVPITITNIFVLDAQRIYMSSRRRCQSSKGTTLAITAAKSITYFHFTPILCTLPSLDNTFSGEEAVEAIA